MTSTVVVIVVVAVVVVVAGWLLHACRGCDIDDMRHACPPIPLSSLPRTSLFSLSILAAFQFCNPVEWARLSPPPPPIAISKVAVPWIALARRSKSSAYYDWRLGMLTVLSVGPLGNNLGSCTTISCCSVHGVTLYSLSVWPHMPYTAPRAMHA